MIPQEMSNPNVRPHLHFLPEDSGKQRCQAWQGKHWSRHMDPELLTPMVREHAQDFYIFEPALVNMGSSETRVVMPHRWFTRGDAIWARTWTMDTVFSRPGWVVLEHQEVDIPLSDFVLSFPELVRTHQMRGLPDPRSILGTSLVIYLCCKKC